jgi:hypothetical protein
MTLTILSEILIPQLYKLRRSLTKNLNCSSQLPIMRLLSRQAAMRLCADPAKGHYDMRNVLLELLHRVVFCYFCLVFVFCTTTL